MIQYPVIDPVALQLGPLSIRWYGLCYLAAILVAFYLLQRRLKTEQSPLTEAGLESFLTASVLGVVFGGRIGYILFYDLALLWERPLFIVSIWEPGLSFHGGLIGVLVACAITAKRSKVRFLAVTDFIAPVVPIGLGFGRLGNFINAELWGRVTDVPWGMIFPGAGPLPRHPSQLYAIFLEGVLLFFFLQVARKRCLILGQVSGVFALGYGCIRFGEEFFRQPDAHLGFIAWGWLTMGQLLCLPLILLGGILLFSAMRRKTDASIS
ncbi:MAG: prolipoprotein diacylglyceryl transferase [Legionellales bacterium]|nr:prolipoprotein diacylglyceryl transferase [Legionellales bacterium]